jgi:hypothetical protein
VSYRNELNSHYSGTSGVLMASYVLRRPRPSQYGWESAPDVPVAFARQERRRANLKLRLFWRVLRACWYWWYLEIQICPGMMTSTGTSSTSTTQYYNLVRVPHLTSPHLIYTHNTVKNARTQTYTDPAGQHPRTWVNGSSSSTTISNFKLALSLLK